MKRCTPRVRSSHQLLVAEIWSRPRRTATRLGHSFVSLVRFPVLSFHLLALVPLCAQHPARTNSMDSVVHQRPMPARKDVTQRPAILRTSVPKAPETVLPELDPQAVAEGRAEFGAGWLGPTRSLPQIAGHGSGADPAGLLPGRWSREGELSVWRAAVRSPGAHALRLRLSGCCGTGSVYLRAGGSASTPDGPYLGPGPQNDGDFWTGIVRSDSVRIEYVRPAGEDLPVRPPFRVTAVAYFIRSPFPDSKSPLSSQGVTPVPPAPRSIVGCHLDVSCYPEWEDREYPSTALIYVTNSEGTLSCAGSLIATRHESDAHLLMLTAGHCIESREEATNAVFVWNYQSRECYGQSVRPSRLVSTTGANLIVSRNDRWADFSLLRLSSRDVHRVTGTRSLGWDGNWVETGTPVVSVSHPDGAFKRVSFGRLTNVRWSGSSATGFTGVSWRQGTTEPGSSGSGVLRETDGLLVGLVTGSSADHEPCDEDYRTAVNRFSVIYDEIERFLESNEAVSEFVPNLPVAVALGTSGETVLITANADGTHWIGESPVTDGTLVTADNGSRYRLRRVSDGFWIAEFVPNPPVAVALGTSGEAVLITADEDGTFRIGESPVTDGATVTAGNGSRYRLRRVPGGSWIAHYEPTTAEIPLLGGAVTLPVLRAENASYWLNDEQLLDGTGLTHADFGTYELRLDRSEDRWHAEPVPAGAPLAAPGLSIEDLAGTGLFGFGGDDGPAREAHLANPTGVAVAPDGNVLIADAENHRIRSVSPAGRISTIAGTGAPGFSGDLGYSTRARVRNPRGVAVGPRGEVYIADSGNNRIRIIAPDGTIDTIAGNGRYGFEGDGGPADRAALAEPTAVALDPDGNLYIADTENHRIRKVEAGIITTVAGTGRLGFGGDGGPARLATLRFPKGAAVDAFGIVYISDTGNNRVRRIGLEGRISTVMGIGQRGFGGDGGPAVNASLTLPRGVAAAPDGSLYVSDSGNHAVRRVRADGVVATVAGIGVAGSSTEGTEAHRARLSDPHGLAVDEDGLLLIADTGVSQIRRLKPSWNTVRPEQLPSPVLVPLEEAGDWVRLWRTGNSTHYYEGEIIESGSVVLGWGGRPYRLEHLPIVGWLATPEAIDAWAIFQRNKQAASTGDVEAQTDLAVQYALGLGVSRDPVQALHWLRRAAAQGYAPAQTWLGLMYETGNGVRQDAAQAAEWYRLAALRGHPVAQFQLGLLYQPDESALDITLRWHSLGDSAADDTDLDESARWMLRSAMQDFSPAQQALGAMYGSGEGVPQNFSEALNWTRLAATAGNAEAQLSLGAAYLGGEWVEYDAREAVRWIRLAADREVPAGQALLGWMYEVGQAVERSAVEAAKWYRRAAAYGEGYAQWRLGVALMRGSGVTRAPVAAFVWLSLALINGEEGAREDWGTVRARLTPDQLRQANSLAARCAESTYEDCP